MRNSWNGHSSTDVIMSGTKEELERRIKENIERGMVLVSEPTPAKGLYVEHRRSYSTLHKPEFTGKDFHYWEKWQCKMRYPEKNLVKS